MRIHIAHSSVYRYEPPAMGVIQVLRLTPRNHEGQYLVGWRIDVTPDARLAAHEDAFGNITHVFTADGPLEELRVEVDGQVETQNTDGVVRGTVERFPPSLFLRDTALTQADDAIRQFAGQVRAARGDAVLAQLHGLLDRLYEEVGEQSAAKQTADQDGQNQAQAGRDSASATGSAAKAFALKRGTPEDLTHIFIGAAHCLGIPARYVGGYFRAAAMDGVQHTSHAWAEAHVADLGWVGFDPWNGFCPTDAHVRVAIGLDSLGAAPMRGTRLGAGAETLAVAIKVDQ
ncbi:MAG TPA: transglutaminase family protein [Xanthobacteraceae bacterium]|jgi:transglutaminase-like putative cysteine protease|nr:transglutaminase family protein [Xanthobacteraceae bacterium]